MRHSHALPVALGLALIASPAAASYGLYVGRHLTADGSVFLGGTGDEVSSHWLEIVSRRTHPAGATIRVGVEADAVIPGELIEIPQVPETARYLTMNYSEFEGFPPPLTNGGLNEHGVAARDIWSPSRPELIEMTPRPQRGPSYSDLSRIVMERATSAREAAALVGELIDRWGYSSYGGNSHLFADAEEGWVLIDFAGGQGLWIAQRLGPDEIRLSYPGYILEIPLDFRERDDFMGSANFVSFAVEQGWYDPDSGDPFDVNAVYGEGSGRSEVVQTIEERLRRRGGGLTLRDVMDTVRDPLLSGDTNGYGQVAHLRAGVPTELGALWVAAAGSITTPFIPYWIGVERVPPEFGKHRYLTKGEATRFVTREWQVQEATRFAYRTFKRLMYFTCDRPGEFLPEVTATLTAFEDAMIGERERVEATARVLLEADRADLARAHLTDYSNRQALEGLRLGEALLGSIEARTRWLHGIREPGSGEMSRLDYEMTPCTASHEPPE